MSLGVFELPAFTKGWILFVLLWVGPALALAASVGHLVALARLRRGEEVKRPSGPVPELAAIGLTVCVLGWLLFELHRSRFQVPEYRFAKIDLSVIGQLEWIALLAGWGVLALAIACVSSLLCWILRNECLASSAHAKVRRSSRALLGPTSAASLAIVWGFWRVHYALVRILQLPLREDWHELLPAHLEATDRGLDRAVVELTIALIASAALASFYWLLPRWSLLERGDPAPAPSARATTVVAVVCTTGALAFWLAARPHVAELRSPLPLTHAFANATLSLVSPVGLRGVGPDSPVEATEIVITPDATRIDGVPAPTLFDVNAIVESKIALRRQIEGSAGHPSGPTEVAIVVMPETSTIVLGRHLSAIRKAGPRRVWFELRHVLTLDRPVLGKLTGVRATMLRVEIANAQSECPAGSLSNPGGDTAGALVDHLLRAADRGRACWVVPPFPPSGR